jgi:hypothetical protein
METVVYEPEPLYQNLSAGGDKSQVNNITVGGFCDDKWYWVLPYT